MNVSIVMLLLVTLCTCSGAGPSASPEGDNAAPSTESALGVSATTFRLLEKGTYGKAANADVDTADRRPVIEIATDPERYQALWVQHIKDSPAPSVDFAKESAVFMIMGPRPTGGYSVTPESIRMDENGLAVQTRVNEPTKKMMTTQAFTAPYAVIAVPAPRLKAGRWYRGEGGLMASVGEVNVR